MSPAECEVVADAGTRLRIIAEGLDAGFKTIQVACGVGILGEAGDDLYLARRAGEYMEKMARHLDEARRRLSALPLEAEGE